MPINENELTKEILAKAMKCETAEDLIALANWLKWMMWSWTIRPYNRWPEALVQ